jgi:hypothetical protein
MFIKSAQRSGLDRRGFNRYEKEINRRSSIVAKIQTASFLFSIISISVAELEPPRRLTNLPAPASASASASASHPLYQTIQLPSPSYPNSTFHFNVPLISCPALSLFEKYCLIRIHLIRSWLRHPQQKCARDKIAESGANRPEADRDIILYMLYYIIL